MPYSHINQQIFNFYEFAKLVLPTITDQGIFDDFKSQISEKVKYFESLDPVNLIKDVRVLEVSQKSMILDPSTLISDRSIPKIYYRTPKYKVFIHK